MVQIARTSITDQSVAWLRTQVQDGVWPIGTKIPPEAELAQELGVARNTVREAVRALVHTGVLEIRRGAGTFVRSDNEVDAVFARRLLQAGAVDIADLRRAIESEASRLACTRRTEADLADLRQALQRREIAKQSSASTDFISADYRFHRTVVRAAHNDLFNELFRCLADEVKVRPNDQFANSSPAQINQAHHDVVEAIAAQNEAAAIQAALIHLDVTTRSRSGPPRRPDRTARSADR